MQAKSKSTPLSAIILKESLEPPCAEMKTHPIPRQRDIKSPTAPVTSAIYYPLPVTKHIQSHDIVMETLQRTVVSRE